MNSGDTTPDEELLISIKSGSELAFSILVRRYAVALHRFAFLHTEDTQLAEDVVQDVFARLWDRRYGITVRTSVQSYLFRATKNKALDLLRHRRSQHRVEDLIGQDLLESANKVRNDGAERIEAEELSRIVQRTLLSLPIRTRKIFMLRRERQMSYEEIAEILDIAIPTVRNQVSKATQVLLSALDRWKTG